MNDSAWERLTDSIDLKVGITRHGRNVQPLKDRPDLHQKIEFVEFEQSGQQFRLERSTGPAITDRKTHYSHRPGVANRIEYVYDPSEEAYKVILFRRADGGWQELDIGSLEL